MAVAGAPVAGAQGETRARWLVPFVVVLFFAWGLATVLIDTLIPKLKGLFELTYAEAMLTQFCFFLAYLVFSIPAGLLLSRVGYLKGIVIGLAVMAAGCLLFSPAAMLGVYPGFLLALFIMAAGITTLQVAANPLIALLGPPETSHSRLNLAQAFNSLGTTIGPLIGAAVILAGGVAEPAPGASAEALAALRQQEAGALQLPFLGIAGGLVVLAAVFWFARRLAAFPKAETPAALGSTLGLLRHRRVALGTLCIFVYVGAEVAIGSLLVNFLMLERTVGLAAADAGRVVSLYWGGAMVGRFIGAFLLRKVPAGVLLGVFALGAAGLAAVAGLSSGMVAAAAVVAVGLCNSIMFPTIFSLTIEGRGEDTPQVSSLLCMAIVGGAIIPVLTGALADTLGLSLALLLPAACYLVIAGFGLSARRPPSAGTPAIEPPTGV